jgi:hypothetical protein
MGVPHRATGGRSLRFIWGTQLDQIFAMLVVMSATTRFFSTFRLAFVVIMAKLNEGRLGNIHQKTSRGDCVFKNKRKY